MTVTSLLILERGFQGLKTHCRAAGGGRKGVSCTGSLPCTHRGRKHPRAALLGHSGFAAISWHARTLFSQTSLGKLLVHTSTHDYHPKPLVFAAFLPPSCHAPICSLLLRRAQPPAVPRRMLQATRCPSAGLSPLPLPPAATHGKGGRRRQRGEGALRHFTAATE